MRKKIWFTSLFVLFIITGYLLYALVIRAQQERYIFCERLILGMTREEVLNILQEFGEIEFGGNITPIGRSHIFAGYVDPQIIGQKTYILNFENGRYINVSVIVGFENGKWVCE